MGYTKMPTSHPSAPFAKLTRSQFTQALPRTRLYQQIENACASAPIIWISAPPGAGKTTLLSSYLASQNRPYLWYQIDAGDADPATFFHYLGWWAQHTSPDTHEVLPALTPEYLPSLATFARRFFEQLYLRLALHGVLVFDNYQEIPADSPVHEVLRSACEVLPAGLQIFVTSRSDIPSSLARQRVHGEIQLLDESALRFTLEEVSALVALRRQRSLSSRCIEQLHTHVQGWAAGLVLLLEQAQRQDTSTLPLTTATQEVLFHYFAGEVLRHASREEQMLLLKTALLPQITAPMAERLTGNIDAEYFLHELHRSNFFIYHREEREVSYEYHPLFRQFLLNFAIHTFTPDELVQLQRQAAVLLEQSGQLEAAAELFCKAGETTALTRLILAQAPVLMRQGRHLTLAHWLQGLPAEAFAHTPWLRYWQGQVLFPFNPTEARAKLEQAYFQFQQIYDVTGLYLAWAGIMQTFLIEWQDFRPIDRWLAEFEALWTRHPEFPSPYVELQTYCTLGVIMWQPENSLLPIWAKRGLVLLREPLDPDLRITFASHLLQYFTWMGNGIQAREVVDILQILADIPDISPLSKILHCQKQSYYHSVLGDIDAALDWANRGCEISQDTGIRMLDFLLLATKVHAYLQRDITQAENALRQMVLLLQTDNLIFQAYHAYLRAWCSWQQGKFDDAWQAGMLAMDLNTRVGGTPQFQAFIDICLVWIALDRGDTHTATDLCNDARAIGRRFGSPVFEYSCRMAEAWNAFEHSRDQEGLASLAAALLECKAMNDMAWVSWGPIVMAKLLDRALAANIETPLTQTLIRRLRLPAPASAGETWPWPLSIKVLGQFSLIVNDKSIQFSGKIPKKPLELLKALLVTDSDAVDIHGLCRQLWPDVDGDTARGNFNVTYLRLRKLLLVEDALLFIDGKLSVSQSLVWTDGGAFVHSVEECVEMLRDPGTTPTSIAVAGKRLIALYQGDLLQEETEYPWLITARDRFRSRYLRTLKALGAY